MGLKKGNTNILAVFKGTTPIKEIYKGENRAFASQTEAPTISFVTADDTQTSLKIRVLNNDSDNLTDISISYSGGPFTQGSLSIASGQTQDFTITGLVPGTSYTFIATADANGKGFSENSNSITRSTLTNQTPTINFQNVTLDAINYTFTNNNKVPANIRTTLVSGSTASNVTGSSTISVSALAGETTSGNVSFSGLGQNSTRTLATKAEINGNLSGQATDTRTTLQTTYSISLSPSSVNEGASTTATITTTNFGSGTLY